MMASSGSFLTTNLDFHPHHERYRSSSRMVTLSRTTLAAWYNWPEPGGAGLARILPLQSQARRFYVAGDHSAICLIRFLRSDCDPLGGDCYHGGLHQVLSSPDVLLPDHGIPRP